MLDETLLWDNGDSPFCLKARICLQLKGVPFRSVAVTLGRVRELRRLNPLGRVPVLVQGSDVVPDASRIARWLEAHHPEPPLIPADPAARAYAGLLEEWADEALHSMVGAFKWLNPTNRAAAVANTVTDVTSGALRPVVGRALAWGLRGRYAASGWGPAALGDLEARMRGNLGILSELLAGKPYLLGQRPMLADVAVFVQLVWMRRYAEGRFLDDAPVVASWLERLGSVPAVAAAVSS